MSSTQYYQVKCVYWVLYKYGKLCYTFCTLALISQRESIAQKYNSPSYILNDTLT